MATETKGWLQMQKDGYRCKRMATETKKAGTFTSSCLRFEDDEGGNVTPLFLT